MPVMKGVNFRQPNLPSFLPEEWTYVNRGGGSGDSEVGASNFNSDATSRILVKNKYYLVYCFWLHCAFIITHAIPVSEPECVSMSITGIET